MAFAAISSTNESRAFSVGPLKAQILTYTAASGDTSGTATADQLKEIRHILYGSGDLNPTTAPSFSANVATLAFVVPATATASLIVQDLTYTAVATTDAGNLITIEYVAGGTAGAEVVTVTGNAISVSMETGVSTATQIRTAINAKAAAIALIVCTVSGTGSTAQVAAAATPLAGGATGGARGSILVLGV